MRPAKRAVQRIIVASVAAMVFSGLMISVARADEAALATGGQAGAPAQPETKTTQALQLLDQGIKHYRAAEYADAGKALDQLLTLQPDAPLALTLREQVGLDRLTAMLAHTETEAQALKLLLLSEQEAQRLRTDTEHIQTLVKTLIRPDIAARIRAERELVACGEFAVPYLLMVMDVEQESAFGWTREERLLARAYAFRALDDMSVRAVEPLIEALHCDNVGLKVQICQMIQKAGDARAIPALKAAAEDGNQPARLMEAASTAATALCEKAGLPTNRTAAEAYLALAESYYYSDPRVIDYVPGLDRTIWSWDPNGKTYPEQLGYKKAPQYAYDEWMTEKLVCDALGVVGDAKALEAYLAKTSRLAPGLPRRRPGEPGDVRRALLALLVADRYSEMEEDRAIAAGKPAIAHQELPADVKAEAARRAVEVDATRPVLRLIGSPVFHDALARFLKDGDYAQAKDCIEDIRILADSTVPEPENTLLKAIYAPVPAVRYAATLTLLEIAPDGAMGGQVQVIANAIAVCSAMAMPGVGVFTAEDTLFTTIETSLRRSGYQAVRVGRISDLIAHAAEVRSLGKLTC